MAPALLFQEQPRVLGRQRTARRGHLFWGPTVRNPWDGVRRALQWAWPKPLKTRFEKAGRVAYLVQVQVIGRQPVGPHPVVAPAPLGGNLCLRRDADTLRVANPDGSDGVAPSARQAASGAWPGFLFGDPRASMARRAPAFHFAARIRPLPPNPRGLSIPPSNDLQ